MILCVRGCYWSEVTVRDELWIFGVLRGILSNSPRRRGRGFLGVFRGILSRRQRFAEPVSLGCVKRSSSLPLLRFVKGGHVWSKW